MHRDEHPICAAALLSNEYIQGFAHMTVAETVTLLKASVLPPQLLNRCFVTTESGIFIGVVDAVHLLRSNRDTPLCEIAERVLPVLRPEDGRENIARAFTERAFGAIPVIDRFGKLCGVIGEWALREIAEDENEEDFAKMSAMTPRTLPYLTASAASDFRARIPWLLLLMLSATFTGMIISAFEDALSTAVYLTAYIPMLMGTGGNAGSQASVTVIRALSLREVTLSDVFRIFRKEFRIALFCALVLAPAALLKLFFVDHLLLGSLSSMGAIYAPAVVALTLFLTIIIAKLIGAMLPLLAKKLGFDPAVTASPFITTAVDTVALALYFALARLLIPGIS